MSTTTFWNRTAEAETEAATLLAAGAALGDIRDVNGTPVVVVPAGFKVEDLSSLLGAPTRLKGTTSLQDAEGFVRFVNMHKTDSTNLYYSQDDYEFRAVLNDNAAGAPGHGDHVARYPMPLSREWKLWTQFDGKRMNQEAFALFIENNVADITAPAGAEMLEIALKFQAKKKIEFESGMRLDNGQNEIVYKETIESKAGEKGKFEIPTLLEFLIPVFDGDAAYPMKAKLRYRIEGAQLQLWYDIENPDRVRDDAVKHLVASIVKGTDLGARTFRI